MLLPLYYLFASSLLWSVAKAVPAGFLEQGVLSENQVGRNMISFSLVPRGSDPDDITKFLLTSKGGSLFLITIKEDLSSPNAISSVDVKEIADFDSKICSVGGAGLLHAIFHPDYQNNGWIYITYSNKEPSPNCVLGLNTGPRGRLSRFQFDFAQNQVDMSSEMVFFNTGRQTVWQHSGGNMFFGNDGMLWTAIGDMGSKSFGQDQGSLKSTLIRLTEDNQIPADNPYAGNSVNVRCNGTGEVPAGSDPDAKCLEIWAYGMSFFLFCCVCADTACLIPVVISPTLHRITQPFQTRRGPQLGG